MLIPTTSSACGTFGARTAIATSRSPARTCAAVAIGTAGKVAALVTTDGALRVVAVDSARRVETEGPPIAAGVEAAAFDPAGRRLATLEANGTIVLREGTVWQPTIRLSRSAPWAPHMGFGRSVSGEHDGPGNAGDLGRANAAGHRADGAGAKGQRTGHQRRWRLRRDDRAGEASVWAGYDTETEVARVGHDGEIRDVVFRPDGRFIATTGRRRQDRACVALADGRSHRGGVRALDCL